MFSIQGLILVLGFIMMLVVPFILSRRDAGHSEMKYDYDIVYLDDKGEIKLADCYLNSN